ncbi:MAG: Tol-Pal system beta propeller repeat protein TolB [Sphingomicrobium sp.]
MLTFLALATALITGATSAQETSPTAQTQTIVQPPSGPGIPTVMIPPLTTPKITDTSAGPTHALGLQVAQIIAADLRSTGSALIIGPDKVRVYSYPEVTGPLFSSWRTLGAKMLVTGFVQARDDKRITIGCYLYDVAAGRELARKGFVVPVDELRRGAHRCADGIYTGLTGKPGMFDSRITYVAESGAAWERIKRVAIMDADGSNHEFVTAGVTSALAPQTSPSGERIAYTAFVNRMPQVRIVDVATGVEQPLLSGPAISFGPTFSPGGQRIVFSIAANGNTDLYAVDANGGVPQRLTATPGADTNPSFSPDGKQIVFESDRSGAAQLYVMNADGSGQRRISFGGNRYSAPSWSSDGGWIAFAKADPRASGIGIMNPRGSDEKMLTSNPLDDGPSWGTSGQSIVFYRPNPSGSRTSLFSVGAGGGEARQLITPQGGSDPSWSAVQQ